MKKQLLVTITLFLSLFFISCEREISFENNGVPGVVTGGGSAGGTAQYDFDGGTATCSGAVLSGTFTAGTAVTAANNVTLTVTVDSIGSWVVTTNTINGISFSGSGTFTATGSQTIILNATGTPTAAGTYNLTPGSDNCAFSVTVAPAPTNVTGDFRAKIDGVQWTADRFSQCARMNNIINITGIGLDKKIITITVADQGVNNYILTWDNTTLAAGAFQDSALTDVTAFTSNAGTSAADGGGVLNITSINETNKTMSGTFSFKAKRHTDGGTRNITEGVFNNIPYITELAPGNANDTFNVKVNGTSFVPNTISGITTTLPSNSIVIQGTDATGVKTVMITCPINVTAGTYAIGFMLDPYYGQYNADNATFLASDSGTLEILFHDPATKRIRGRFNYSASELVGPATAEITEGYFAVTYL